MRAVLVSRYPRVDTKAWKQRVAADLLADGVDVSVLYSRASLVDQALAGIREEGPGVVRRYMALRGRRPSVPSVPATRSLADWAAERGLRVDRRHRLDDAVDDLRRLAPDLLVLVGADVVPPAVLAIPRLGTINAHYALLPEFRGMNVAEWSVFCGAPVGVTVHLVNAGIDTGPIVLREEIALGPGETFETLRAKQQDLAARLLVRAARDVRDGTASPVAQDAAAGRQYFRMHPALRREAEARLRSRAG
jgi:methionyl-tRNA formyltransferase